MMGASVFIDLVLAMRKISSILLVLFFFLLPLNIKVPFYSSGFSSIQSDYNIFFVYPVELLLFLSVLFFIPQRKISGPFPLKGWLFWLTVVSLPSFFLSIDKHLSLLLLLRLLELAIVAVMIARDTELQKKYMLALLIGLGFQGLLAGAQFYTQQSAGLSFLGESVFNGVTFNTARLVGAGETLVRAYGTFPHPNILGGFMAVGAIFLIIAQQRYRKYLPAWAFFPLLLLILFGLFFSFSRSAYLAFFIGLIVLIICIKEKKRVLISAIVSMLFAAILVFCFPFVSDRFENAQTENSTRINQYESSLKMIAQHPLGVGWGNGVLAQEQNINQEPLIWNLQPIHNTFLLGVYELGVFAGIVLLIGYIGLLRIALVSVRPETIALPLALLVPLMTDHYMVTSFQGLMLLGLVIGMVLSSKRDLQKVSVLETFSSENS